MTGITIPAALHESMVRTLRSEYEDEFGSVDKVFAYTRDELVEKYARVMRFWFTRVPEIAHDRRPDLQTVCAHAIATNALTNMRKLVEEYDIVADVRARLRDAYDLDYDG